MQLYAIYIITRLLPPPSPQPPLGFLMAPDPWVELSLNQPHCLILCLGVAFSEISLDVSSCPTLPNTDEETGPATYQVTTWSGESLDWCSQ